MVHDIPLYSQLIANLAVILSNLFSTTNQMNNPTEKNFDFWVHHELKIERYYLILDLTVLWLVAVKVSSDIFSITF